MSKNQKENSDKIDEIVLSIFKKFKNEFQDLKDGIMEMMKEYILLIKKDIANFNKNIEKKLSEHEEWLQKHEETLGRHSKDIKELEKSMSLTKKMDITKVKVIIGLIAYGTINLGVLIISLIILFKILGK